jgi:hypothetical protein
VTEESKKPPSLINDNEFSKILSDSLGPLASTLLLVPQDGSDVPSLDFDWSKAKQYYTQYCRQGNDCPDDEFDSDCTHFVSHGLSKTKIIVNNPTAFCTNGVCIRVAELAAAFKNSADKYSNVTKITDLATTLEGDFCFVVSWFGLRTDHAMVLAGKISSKGGNVYGHTNSRCGTFVDLTGQSLVVYRIG